MFSDFVVGAYASDKAFVFRSRPIVVPKVNIYITPSPIPLDGTNSTCNKIGIQICFQAMVVFEFSDRGSKTGKPLGDLSNISKSCFF